MTTWTVAHTLKPNRNIAGKKNLKSLPVAFFSQIFNIDITVEAQENGSFSKWCDVIQDGRPFSKYLGRRGHFGISNISNKIQKDPVFGST